MHASVRGSNQEVVWLNNARIVSVFAVVLLHVSGGVLLRENIGSEYWWYADFYESLVRWCVPVLVMISGALLLDSAKLESCTEFYVKRYRKILLPLLFWSVFYIASRFINEYVCGNTPKLSVLFESLLYGKPYYHMWFIYMMAVLYLFVPLLRKFVHRLERHQVLLVTAAAFIPVIALGVYRGLYGENEVPVPLLPLEYIPYFLSGHIIRTAETRRALLPLLGTIFSAVILTALLSFRTAIDTGHSSGNYFYSYISINVVVLSLATMCLFKHWNKPVLSESATAGLAGMTLGIYLVHPVIIRLTGFENFLYNLISPLISLPLAASIVFMLSLAVCTVISRMPFVRRTI